MKIKKHSDGFYYAHLRKHGQVALHTKSATEAAQIAQNADLEKLEMLALADAVSAAAVNRILGCRISCMAALEKHWDPYARMELSLVTTRTYRTAILAFFAHSELGNQKVSNITEQAVHDWVNAEDGTKVTTRRSRLAALSSFTTVLSAKGVLQGDPSKLVSVKLGGLSFEKKEIKHHEPFTEEEIAKLYAVEDSFWSVAIRLSNECGLRMSDCAQVTPQQFVGDRVIVWMDKTDKRIELPAPSGLRLPTGKTGEEHCFPSEAMLSSDPQGKAMLSTRFSRLLRKLGIQGKSFHGLRHTFAVRHKNLGSTVDEIRLLLGHASSETTKIYTNHE